MSRLGSRARAQGASVTAMGARAMECEERHLPACGLLYNPDVPTLLRIGPYRFFVYSADRDEPPHVHVEREGNVGKFWLDPVRLESSGGFSRNELRRIGEHVARNQEELLRGWHEFFGG